MSEIRIKNSLQGKLKGRSGESLCRKRGVLHEAIKL